MSIRRTSLLLAPRRALALSVYFKQPELGMKDYEILSRASAFLLSIEPYDDKQFNSSNNNNNNNDDYQSHQQKASAIIKKQDYKFAPAGGPRRRVQELSWLEYCPSAFRPTVHIMAASHVLAPWMWKEYYTQPWLSKVTQDHCKYELQVFEFDEETDDDGNNNTDPKVIKPLATVPLNPTAIHHPNEKDLAIIHLKNEEENLGVLRRAGAEILYLRDVEKQYKEHDPVTFEGFFVTEDEQPATAKEDVAPSATTIDSDTSTDENDDRIFIPYREEGTLFYSSADRFLAKTETPLPEGLCGGPVLDSDGRVCGIVEGIVPKDHEDKRIAGAASFLPNFSIVQFLDHAEHIMLTALVPPEILERAQELKETGEMGNETLSGEKADSDFDKHLKLLRETHSPEEVDAIMKTLAREKEEVLDIMNRKGGDLEDAIKEVRAKTLKIQEEMLAKHGKADKTVDASDVEEAETIDSDKQKS